MPTKRILCVDDDESTCEMMVAMLGYADLEAISVHDVGEALQLMEREQFSLYILDGQLPGMTGLTLCAKIRAIDKTTPIIIFSGRAYPSDITEGMLEGANAYLVKPDSSLLVTTVRLLLDAAPTIAGA